MQRVSSVAQSLTESITTISVFCSYHSTMSYGNDVWLWNRLVWKTYFHYIYVSIRWFPMSRHICLWKLNSVLFLPRTIPITLLCFSNFYVHFIILRRMQCLYVREDCKFQCVIYLTSRVDSLNSFKRIMSWTFHDCKQIRASK